MKHPEPQNGSHSSVPSGPSCSPDPSDSHGYLRNLTAPRCKPGSESLTRRRQTPTFRPAMAETRTTDLTTLDTEALRKRIAELGRYL